ncbi:LOW QUALITY PROTEIN: F-box/WD repeat-containing protein 7-like [Haliotis rubra]|uniref:LOW QUALITY PROTEIN: F-box/WD repeat-containing protein 7-like n=1 Tax=Haliotis rubra TaxID=36100 RepID=UPI001EE55638|nr:LOW QUALITY PROTEIN: F-box/WD repeat-containing protein 7-like [Haliotis rubra]
MNKVEKMRNSFPKIGVLEGQGGREMGGAVTWRGHGGVHPTPSSVEFDRQLDKVAIWLEHWDHDERCCLLESLLRKSNYRQFQFLYTVMQPTLHRDFMYTARSHFPDIDFQPVSTHTSRELKEKVTRLRQNNYFRVKSAYLQLDDDVKAKFKDTDCIKLPHLATHQYRSEPVNKSAPSLLKLTSKSVLAKLPQGHQAAVVKWGSTSSISTDTQQPPQHVDTLLRFVEMPVRRHMQDETSPRVGNNVRSSLTSDSTNTGNSSTDSQLLSTAVAGPRKKRKLKLSYVKDKSRTIKHEPKTRVSLPPCQLSPDAQQLMYWYTDVWNNTRKNEFFHKLLLKLDPRQHYFISNFLTIKQHRDFLALLPEHLALKILSYLSPAELLQASRVNKTWHCLANNNELWRSKCNEVKMEVRVNSAPIWKKLFRDNMYLRLNWNNGVCRKVDLQGHTESVLSVTFDETRLASGSMDQTIKLWDIKSGELLQTLKGHTRGVWCLNFYTKHLLISGSYDSTIRIWNLRSGGTTRTLLGHEGPVWAMVRRGSKLVTTSQDKTAKVWDIGRCLLLHTLSGHHAAVFAVDMTEDGDIIVTGSADRSVRLWDCESSKCKKVIWISQTTSIMSVSFSNGYLACSYGETICLYRVKDTKLIRTFQEHRKRVESVELRIAESETFEGMIVSAGKDGLLKYWDVNKEESIQTFAGHSEQVNCIRFDELRIASASYDHKIRIWDFNV